MHKFIFFLINIICRIMSFFFFFFNDTAPTEIYTLSLHDALPIYQGDRIGLSLICWFLYQRGEPYWREGVRSEEHTSELQSRFDLVCRLLLEKKKKIKIKIQHLTTSYISTPNLITDSRLTLLLTHL